jgi:hypothetical protein
VNDSLRTKGLAQSTSPTRRAWLVVTMLNTPAGKPASAPSSASAMAVSGVCIGGLSTIVQPDASAGAALRVIIAAGKFQGVMAATTPTGCRIVT